MPITPFKLMIAGTIAQAGGMVIQGLAAKAQSETEAAILEQNAKIKEREAEAERKAAEVEAEQFARRGKELIGTQRVGYAKGGVLAEGTPALLLEETAAELEKDRLQILKEGYLRGGFRESEATGLRFEGTAAKTRGTSALTGSVLSAGGTLLTGYGTSNLRVSISDKYLKSRI